MSLNSYSTRLSSLSMKCTLRHKIPDSQSYRVAYEVVIGFTDSFHFVPELHDALGELLYFFLLDL